MNAGRPRILVVEDDFQLRRLLRSELGKLDMEVLEARACLPALQLAGEQPPDLVILDLGLPDHDGVHFIDEFRLWSRAPVLVLTARFSEAEKIRALDAGADDYLTKPFGIGELAARLRALFRRPVQAVDDPRVHFGEVLVDLSRHSVSRAGTPVHLTATEFRLLAALLNNPGRVLTHHQLVRLAWGQGAHHEPAYLRVYVGRLRQKLEVDPARPAHLQTEIGVGYRFVPDPAPDRS